MATAAMMLACLLAVSAQAAAAPACAAELSATVDVDDDAPLPGRALTLPEVRALYSNRTWVWPGGGGYMDESGQFLAVGGQENGAGSYGQGSWIATDNGYMCFGGVWNMAGKSTYVRTCLAHRMEGDAILQRKGPCGPWYAFRSSPPQAADEINKLVAGDQISAKLKRLQALSKNGP